jgi:hypothetical protein
MASELEKKQKEMKSTTKELTDIRKSLKGSEAKKKKTEKVLKDAQKEMESTTKELEDTQLELGSYEKHVMEHGTAAFPVVLRPASSIVPPDLFVSPPESGLLRKAAPSSSEVSYVFLYRPPSLPFFLPLLFIAICIYICAARRRQRQVREPRGPKQHGGARFGSSHNSGHFHECKTQQGIDARTYIATTKMTTTHPVQRSWLNTCGTVTLKRRKFLT